MPDAEVARLREPSTDIRRIHEEQARAAQWLAEHADADPRGARMGATDWIIEGILVETARAVCPACKEKETP